MCMRFCCSSFLLSCCVFFPSLVYADIHILFERLFTIDISKVNTHPTNYKRQVWNNGQDTDKLPPLPTLLTNIPCPLVVAVAIIPYPLRHTLHQILPSLISPRIFSPGSIGSRPGYRCCRSCRLGGELGGVDVGCWCCCCCICIWACTWGWCWRGWCGFQGTICMSQVSGWVDDVAE